MLRTEPNYPASFTDYLLLSENKSNGGESFLPSLLIGERLRRWASIEDGQDSVNGCDKKQAAI